MRKLLLAPILAATLMATLAAAAGASSPVYIAISCREPRVKPYAVVFACADGNLYATRLSYTGYGAKRTTASGLFHSNDCTPNCAAGKFHGYQGKVTFSAIEKCGKRLFYTRAEYDFSGPDGKGTADVAPLGMRCHKP